MQTMPGMTQQQRSAAGDSWRQFHDRLFGNRQQQSYGQPTSQPSQPRSSQPSVMGWPTQQQPAKPTGGAPDMSAYRPPAMAQPPSGRPSTGGWGRQPAAPGYGGGWGPDGIRTHDFRDRDGDGVDDRDQTGPGAPRSPRNPGAAQPIQPPPQGTPYDPAKAFRDAGMPGLRRDLMVGQVVTQAKDGSWWGDPLQAAAYDRWLASQNPQGGMPSVRPIPQQPAMGQPGDIVEQDWGTPTNIRGPGVSPASPQEQSARQQNMPQWVPRRAASAPPRASVRQPASPARAQPIPPPPQGTPYGQGPTGFPTPVQDMFTFGGFAPAPPPPRPDAPPPVEAAWYPMQGVQGHRRLVEPARIPENYDFDEQLRIQRRLENPRLLDANQRRVNWQGEREITRQEREITQRLRDQVFAGPRAEREAAIAAQEAEYQRRMDQRYGTPSFTQQAIGWDGSVMSPQQNMAQRDAFIQRLNDARTPVAAAAGVYNQGMAPTPPPLNRDFASMWSQAGNMVANGWTNPLIGLFG